MKEKRHLKPDVILRVNKQTVWKTIKNMDLSSVDGHFSHPVSLPMSVPCTTQSAQAGACWPQRMSAFANAHTIWSNNFSEIVFFITDHLCFVILFKSRRARLQSQLLSLPTWVCRSGRIYWCATTINSLSHLLLQRQLTVLQSFSFSKHGIFIALVICKHIKLVS